MVARPSHPRSAQTRAPHKSPVRPARPARPARARDEARALFRNAILEAAEAAFSEMGFHDARIQDIAARARMAVGTIYNHFGQKEDVLRALLEERAGELLATVDAAPGDPRDFEAALAARVERVLAYVALHRGFFALATEHGLLGGATAAARRVLGKKKLTYGDRFRAVLRGVIEEGIAVRAIEARDPELLARFLGSVIRTGALQVLDDVETARADAARTLVALFLRGAEGTARTRKEPPRAKR